MINKKSENFEIRSFVAVIFILGLICFLSAVSSFGQTNAATAQTEVQTDAVQIDAVQTEKPTPALQPVYTEYKGVRIGMTADEVRAKIDKKPKIEDKDGYYYIFSDNEALQIVLDEDKKVKVISVMYSGENSNAPTYESVFGKEVPLETAQDGRIYNLVRYPAAGYWVAYSSSAGENPTVTITIQQL
jgi:hypothetical protein